MFNFCFDGKRNAVALFFSVISLVCCVCVCIYFVCVVKSVAVYDYFVEIVFSVYVAEVIAVVICPLQDIVL